MEKPQPPRRAPLWRVLPLLLILTVALTGAYFLRDVLSFDALREHRLALLAYRDAHYVGTVLIFIAVYAAIVSFSLPGATVTTLTGGFLFGLFPGVLFNMIGATLGACGIFLAARWGLGERLAARMDAASGRIHRIKAGLDENQWSMLFLIRLLPVVPFFVANLLPALLNVPLWRFAVSTFLGIIPGALIYTSVGSGLGAVFAAGGTPDLMVIFQPQILLPILALSALVLLPVALKALRKGAAL